jgi:hypothetical protein
MIFKSVKSSFAFSNYKNVSCVKTKTKNRYRWPRDRKSAFSSLSLSLSVTHTHTQENIRSVSKEYGVSRTTLRTRTAYESNKVGNRKHRPSLSPLPQEISLVLISVRGRIESRTIARLKRLSEWTIFMSPSGIDPANFRLGAECLKQQPQLAPLPIRQAGLSPPMLTGYERKVAVTWI